MVGRYLEGVGVTDETIAIDEIQAVGHFPNNYLAQEHYSLTAAACNYNLL